MPDATDTRPTAQAVKLRPPALPADHLARTRLTRQILRGLERPLTLICAPAGFGKTIALRAALTDYDGAYVWLSLDATDDGPAPFVRQLVAAVRTVFPDACRSSLGLFQLPTLPAADYVSRVLADDLASLPHALLVVLDDFHWVEHPYIHTLVAALLRHPPATLHVAIASRSTPPLSLARLRAQEQLAEVDLTHLRFGPEEARAFLTRATGAPVGADEAAAIHTRVHGWAVGLRFAATALRDWASSPAVRPVVTQRADQYAEAYLWEEIVTRQPPDMQDFLLCTSVVERFCASLADALMGWNGTPEASLPMIARLRELGLFVEALGDQRDWYRYHDLFRDALQRNLRLRRTPAAVRTLHRRASTWLAREGPVDEAVRHALAADDPDGAARLVEARRDVAFDSEGWPRLQGWLELVPEDVRRRRPALLLAEAWVAYFRFSMSRIPPLLRAALEILDGQTNSLSWEEDESLRAEIDLLEAAASIVRGEAQQATACARQAWERLPIARPHLLAQAGSFLGIALQMSGQAEAVPSLLSSARAAELDAQPSARLRLLAGVLYARLAEAQFRELEPLARQAVQLAERLDHQTMAAWAHYWLGRVYYEWNDLPAARACFAAVVERRDRAHFLALAESLQGLALTYRAMGQPAEAAALADEAVELALTTGRSEQQEIAHSFRARLAALSGDAATAARWLPIAGTTAPFQLPLAIEVPTITRARVLIAEGGPAALGKAADSLAELLTEYEAHHDTLRTIEVLALQAVACRAQGELEPALATLQRAIDLAAPGGLLRTFVDLGPPMAGLLVELARGREHAAYLAHLLTVFGTTSSPATTAAPDRDEALVLVDRLTDREREVLHLLARRMTYKEIAAELGVSWQTAGKHAGNLYQKLQVSGRRAAVERARRLGLLAGD